MYRFDHFNFNVFDLEKSMAFYKDALDLIPIGEEKVAKDGSYRIVFLTDKSTHFRLELTWLRDRKGPYDLGEQEYHLALRTEDFRGAYERHKQMNVICYENPQMGIYFISDPDGYWIEILPPKAQQVSS